MQIWVAKTINHHSMYHGLFAGSYLLTTQKPASECYVIEQFLGMIVQQSLYYQQRDVFRGLHTIRNKTGNLH